MKLKKLLYGIDFSLVKGSLDTEITSVAYDSRKAEKNGIFVCIEGFKTDGHKYAKSAAKNGASVILCQRPLEEELSDVTIIKTGNTRKALAYIARNFYENPSGKLKIIGVTGTNGKTTTTFLIKSVLDRLKIKTGLIGTIENRIGDKILISEHTTPESLELNAIFAKMLEEGVSHVLMEVSSHSLDLYRVEGINFEIGIFTNITPEHMDYHITMENYTKAKSKLFVQSKYSVINKDDPSSHYMLEKTKSFLTFGIERTADINAKDIKISPDGVLFELSYKGKSHKAALDIPGKFSIYNALGAIGACLLLGIKTEDILSGIKQCKGVPGRFQSVKGKNGVRAIVDYAHTPDGLENVLKTAKQFAFARIITVFGCGGDRDRTKRCVMGEIAGRYSDFCIITSDNPRTENPLDILKDIEPGVKKTGCPYTCIVDRKEAIFFAVNSAEKDDIIMVAGKGHEDYQIFRDKTIHFDDCETIKEAFGEV